jgi:hypothetical protein
MNFKMMGGVYHRGKPGKNQERRREEVRKKGSVGGRRIAEEKLDGEE